MSTPDLNWIPARYIYAVSGVLVTTILSMVAFAVKRFLKGMQAEWKTATARLEVIETTTRNQAENHLATIQGEAIKQTALLQDIRTEQASLLGETNGYLKAVVDSVKK